MKSETTTFERHAHLIQADSGESGTLLRLALPVVGANIVGLLDSSVNAAWVGHYLGDTAFAGVSNANTVLLFLFAGVLGVWMAVAIRTGLYLGAGRTQDTKRLVRAVWIFAAAGVCVAIVVALFNAPLLEALSVPQDALPQARQYLGVILLAVPFIYVYGMVVAVLRGAGNTRLAFYFSLFGVALDAALNPMLIFGLGGLPRMGVAGSAWATVLAQAITCGGLVGSLYWRRHFLCLRWGEILVRRADLSAIGDLFRQGGPMGFESLWKSILAMLMMTLVNRFGSNVTAAYGAAIQLWAYVVVPSEAITLAVTSMAAQHIGAKRSDRLRGLTHLAVTYSMVATGLLLLILEVLNRSAFSLFLPSASPALVAASKINHVASGSLVLLSGYEALLSTLRAAGAVWGPLALSVFVLGAQLPIAAVLLQFWGDEGIWWSFPISGVIAGIAVVLYYRRRVAGTVQLQQGTPFASHRE